MPPIRKPLDVAALQNLSEPLTVRVERVNGVVREPISLPDAPNADYTIDNPPEVTTVAVGWNVDQVRSLESWILGWTGGGNYAVSVTDSNNQVLEWAFNYSTRDHKPRPSPSANTQVMQQQPQGIQPPPSAIAHAVSQGIPVQMAQQPQQPMIQVPMSMMPSDQQHGGLPPASAYGQQFPQQPYVAQQVPMYFQTPLAQRLPSNATPDQRLEYENRALRDTAAAATSALAQQQAQAVAQAQEVRYREELRLRDAQHDKEMQILRDQIAAMSRPRETDVRSEIAAALAAALTPLIEQLKPKDDDKFQRALDESNRRHEADLRVLRDEQARKDAEAARERDRLETQRREDQIRAEMRENSLRLEKLVEQFAAQSKNHGPDPTLQLMQQVMTMQADTAKQVAQQQTLSTQQLAQFMMPPSQMVAMLKEASGSSEGMLRGLADSYGNVMAMMQAAMTTIVQMQPAGGNPIVDAVQGIAQKAGELGDKWLATQQAGVVQGAKTQQTAIQAQRDVMMAQAAAQQPVIVQAQPAPAAQLAPPPVIAQPAPIVAANANKTGADGMPLAIKRHGHTDEEWFGPALPEVQNLRLGAAAFIESMDIKPIRRDAKGQIVGLTPAQTARYLTAAAATIIQQKADILAFTKLFMQDLHADLMDILLPDIQQEYRDLCVKFLSKQLDPSIESEMFTDAAVAQGEEADEEETEPSEEEIRESDGGAIPIARALPKKPTPSTSTSPH